jgi:hypothetical protein
MKKIVELCRHKECGMFDVECAKPFAIHFHDGSTKFEWIWFQALKNFKSL